MPAQQKPKTGKTTNDNRRNKKAAKKAGAARNRSTRLSELNKVLLGGGALRRIGVPLPKETVDKAQELDKK